MVHVKKLFFVIALGLSAYSYSEIERPLSWQSRLYVDHVLVGKIWDSANQEFVSIEEFTSAIEESRYLILGEKHDNPDHHELQLAILNHLLDLNLVSLVAFEMMDSDSQERLDTLHSAKNQDSEALKEYLQWDEEGWEWLFYGPLIYSAYSSGVSIKASNLSNSRMMEIYGLSELPPELDIFDDVTPPFRQWWRAWICLLLARSGAASTAAVGCCRFQRTLGLFGGSMTFRCVRKV